MTGIHVVLELLKGVASEGINDARCFDPGWRVNHNDWLVEPPLLSCHSFSVGPQLCLFHHARSFLSTQPRVSICHVSVCRHMEGLASGSKITLIEMVERQVLDRQTFTMEGFSGEVSISMMFCIAPGSCQSNLQHPNSSLWVLSCGTCVARAWK